MICCVFRNEVPGRNTMSRIPSQGKGRFASEECWYLFGEPFQRRSCRRFVKTGAENAADDGIRNRLAGTGWVVSRSGSVG